MPKKAVKTVDFTRPYPLECPRGTGLVVTDEMKQLLAQPGFLCSTNGGPQIRQLYHNNGRQLLPESMQFDIREYSDFGQLCFSGSVATIHEVLLTGQFPPLHNTESSYEFGYATLIIAGSQRRIAMPGTAPTQHLETLKFLISRDLPLDVPDIGGYAALHHVILGQSYRDREQLIRTLITSGANINLQNRWGDTPLHHAVDRGDTLAIDVLLELGARIDIPQSDGWTVEKSYVKAGPTVVAAVEKWILKRAGKAKAPLTGKSCDQCGASSRVSLKNCSKCLTVQYCSRECQRAAWPEHKKKCKPFSQASSLTLSLSYFPEMGRALIPLEPLVRGYYAGLPTDPVPVNRMQLYQVPNIPPGGKEVVVKIQTPQPLKNEDGSYNMLLIYTQKRDLGCVVRREDCPEEFDCVCRIIEEEAVSGAKAYFVARLESRDKLVVKVSELLASQHW